MTTSLTPNGLKYIMDNEGCVLHPYEDAGGVATIGYGMTHYPNGTPVTMNDEPITQAQADAYFPLEVAPYLATVLEVCTVPLNSNQLASLTDLCYNIGIGAYRLSTLRQHVNQNCVVESDFTVYCNVDREVNQGLLNRRKSEYQLFITNVPNVQTSVAQPIKTMDNTLITPETPSVVKINSITVNLDIIQNGVVVQSGATEPVTITPELITALQSSSLVASGATNVSVVA